MKTAAKAKRKHAGDILGISDADPHVTIPAPADKGSGHAIGIDVRGPATGLGDVPQRTPATVDMGAGGDGTGVASHTAGPLSLEPETQEEK